MEVKHTTIRNEKLFCLHCGGDFKLTYPIAIQDMLDKTKSFNELHKDCKKTWTEPTADQSKSVKEKAMWWIANSHVGNSSKTMWLCLMGEKIERVYHPYDSDDFSRCYNLLEAVPEWKNELHKIKQLSKEWSNLVDNWDKLTEMYEQNVKDNWKNHNKIGMYEFIQKLIND